MQQSQAVRRTSEQIALEREAKFPKDSIVRLQPEAAASYNSGLASKLKDRIGRVMGHQLFARHPIIAFPAIGRHSAFTFVSTYCLHELEIVTDAVELAAWQAAVDEKAEKIAKALAAAEKKRLKAKAASQ